MDRSFPSTPFVGTLPVSQPRRSLERFYLGLAMCILIGWAVAMKSAAFVDGEPVVLNYIVSGASIGLVSIWIFLAGKPYPISKLATFLSLLAVGWATLSAIFSGIDLNLLAAASFFLLILGFGFCLPVLSLWSGLEAWRVLNYLLSIMTLLSTAVLLLGSDLGIDPESGRFRGVYVSVAIACTMFALNVLLSAKEALSGRFSLRTLFWLGVAAAALADLYLTRTRSSLAELMAGLLLLILFAPLRQGVRMAAISFVSFALVFAVLGLSAVSTGIVRIDDQLQEFRLADSDLTDARGSNWEFGIERIQARPLFGEGLLAKQTQGGAANVDFSAQTSYDPRYDPHSQALTSGVQGGIPFMILMLSLFTLIPARFILAFGWRQALQSPELIAVSLRLSVSMFSGGDMTSLGSIVDKVFWLLLGVLALKTELRLRNIRKNGTAAVAVKHFPRLPRHPGPRPSRF